MKNFFILLRMFKFRQCLLSNPVFYLVVVLLFSFLLGYVPYCLESEPNDYYLNFVFFVQFFFAFLFVNLVEARREGAEPIRDRFYDPTYLWFLEFREWVQKVKNKTKSKQEVFYDLYGAKKIWDVSAIVVLSLAFYVFSGVFGYVDRFNDNVDKLQGGVSCQKLARDKFKKCEAFIDKDLIYKMEVRGGFARERYDDLSGNSICQLVKDREISKCGENARAINDSLISSIFSALLSVTLLGLVAALLLRHCLILRGLNGWAADFIVMLGEILGYSGIFAAVVTWLSSIKNFAFSNSYYTNNAFLLCVALLYLGFLLKFVAIGRVFCKQIGLKRVV